MSTRNTVQASILSALALTMLCLCSSVATAQKVTPSTNGTPIRGADVKLGSNPGGNAAARTTTDENGNFTFPVLPKGEYTLTMELKKETSNTAAARSSAPANDEIELCLITLNLPGCQKVEMGYDLKENEAFDPKIDPTKQSTSKRMHKPLLFRSDGVTPLNGKIIKSRSNIKNNARTGNPN